MVRAVFALFACVAAAAPASAATPCEALARLALPGASIASAVSVPAGSFTPPVGKPIANLPAFCRVTGVISPAADSNIRFEVWMPGSGWNAKFEGAGNGGFAGVINYSDMASAISHGYATASTDTGHQAGGTDAAWALGHPERIADFGYRAIHDTAEKAKAVIGAFYGQGPRHSYFASCSNGGRQALMEAQRFPADYEGIIAGAPANFWTHLLAAAAFDIKATLADPGSYIPPRKLPAIQAAVLSACDALDGVKDGLIENPAQCHFKPATLLCQGPESDSCLTATQIEALTKVYTGPRNSQGEQVFPGYSPGGEAEPGGWAAWITGGAPQQALMYAFGTQFFQNMVYEDPAWDFRTFQVDRDTKNADDKMAQVLNATDSDLKRFKERGGKLILYHGWSDAAIPAQSTIDYYQTVVSKMGASDSAAFVRLFMVPGMQHCGGGSGPNSFGAGAAQGDPQHDMGRALERWVEDGVAPEQVIATGYKSGSNPASGVSRTRPLCPYPQIARWRGSGSTDDAANFVCTKPALPTAR
jgi:feruloyl esterase